MKNKKVILDTNLWISFLISKQFSQLDALIEHNKITLVFSDELLEEFIDVAHRPKFKKYFSKKDIEKILDYFDFFAELVPVRSEVELCRDKEDNFLLNLAIDSKADFLITGDRDLLVLGNIRETTITTLTHFIANMK